MKPFLFTLSIITLFALSAIAPAQSVQASTDLDLTHLDTQTMLEALEALEDINVNLSEEHYIFSVMYIEDNLENPQGFYLYTRDTPYEIDPEWESVDTLGSTTYTYYLDTEAWGDYDGMSDPAYIPPNLAFFTDSNITEIKAQENYRGDVRSLTPTFTGAQDTYYLPLGHALLASNINMQATDQLGEQLTKTYDFTPLDSFDQNAVGEYELTATITNAVGNSSSKQITVIVTDSTPPTITAPQHIAKDADFILSNEFMLRYATATDNTGEDITDSIYISSNEFKGNGNNSGLYDVVLSAHDENGNRSDHHMQIRVLDNYMPMLLIDDHTMLVSKDRPLTSTGFISSLQRIGDLPLERFDYTNVIDTYSVNQDTTGEYRFQFHLVSDSGNEYTRSLDVEVVDHDFNYEDAPLNTAQNAMGFFTQWWWLIAIGAIAIVGIIKR